MNNARRLCGPELYFEGWLGKSTCSYSGPAKLHEWQSLHGRASAQARKRRRIIEYEEEEWSRSQDFALEREVLREAGDGAGERKLTDDFAAWRKRHRQDGEAEGLRNAGVNLSTNIWHHWGVIAFAAEREAIAATAERHSIEGNSDPTDALGRSFRAGLTAVVAAAFMVEGLFGAVCYFVPPQAPRRRWAVMLQTLRMEFDLSGIPRLQQEMQRLFQLRDDAAHPWVATEPPVAHPEGFGNTSRDVATYTAATATASIDLATQLLLNCAKYPLVTASNASAVRWASGHLPGIERLLELRGPDDLEGA